MIGIGELSGDHAYNLETWQKYVVLQELVLQVNFQLYRSRQGRVCGERCHKEMLVSENNSATAPHFDCYKNSFPRICVRSKHSLKADCLKYVLVAHAAAWHEIDGKGKLSRRFFRCLKRSPGADSLTTSHSLMWDVDGRNCSSKCQIVKWHL